MKPASSPDKVGIIGGSGLYQMDGLRGARWALLRSSFGKASDQGLHGELGNAGAVFLPRHARGHRIPPSLVNYRANVEGLKAAGCRDVLSLSAVGSLKEGLPPGTFVIVDQFIDRTFAREKSFFGRGLVAHVSMAHPVCRRLGDHLEAVVKELNIPYVRGGIYLAMEGPQFSSLAESKLYRSWGCDVIGMTNMPEAKLAREAELCYATVAMVTDFDCWHPDHDHVSVDTIVKTLHANADNARALVREVLPRIAADTSAPDCPCRRALDHAILTAPSAMDSRLKKKLKVVAGRVLGAQPS